MNRSLLQLAVLVAVHGVVAAQAVHPSVFTAPVGTDASRRSAFAGVFAERKDAVVQVLIEVTAGRRQFPIVRHTSGVVIDPSGIVLTFWSAVAEAEGAPDKTLYVVLGDGNKTRRHAKVLRKDEASNLVLLQVETPAPMAAVELADSAQVRPGQAVAVLAFCEEKDFVSFGGVLAAPAGPVRAFGRERQPGEVLLCDLRGDMRAHGGAVFAADGKVIGLYSSENVRHDVRDPTAEDLKQPSYPLVITTAHVQRTFGKDARLVATTAADVAGSRAVARGAAAVATVWSGDGPFPAADPLDPYAGRRRTGLGSGVVVSKAGLVLTNAHVVRGDRARVRLADGREFMARVLRRDQLSNVAMLQLEEVGDAALPVAACGRSAQARLGETVYAVGRPHAGANTVSAGVVSARRPGGRLQADPNLGNHNGGGALLNGDGELIAIVDGGVIDPIDQAIMARGDGARAENNLRTCVGIDTVRQQFQAELGAAGPAESIVAPPERAETAGHDEVTRVVDRLAGAMLNVYISTSTIVADEQSNPFASVAQAEVQGHSLGSGVLIDPSGLAISNWHVVDAATDPDGSERRDHVVSVRLFDGRKLPARVLSISRDDDLSLLQVVAPDGQTLGAAELGDSGALQVGERVLAIGNPLGNANTITSGIVVAKNQEIYVKNRWAELQNLIEADASIDGGNSGGALLDGDGRLVGINSAGGGTIQTRGYAIPVDHVRDRLLNLLLTPEKLRSPSLGMVVKAGDGAMVASVDPEGPAARAGVQVGDRIATFAGKPVRSMVEFALLLRTAAPDQVLELGLQRGGTAVAVQATPMSADAWAVRRQSRLETSALSFHDAPEQVRAASVALHRHFVQDAKAEPSMIAESLVRIDRVLPELAKEGCDARAGDLLLAIELNLAQRGGDLELLQRFTTLAEVKTWFNDGRISTYEGVELRCLFYRDGKVLPGKLAVKRLMP